MSSAPPVRPQSRPRRASIEQSPGTTELATSLPASTQTGDSNNSPTELEEKPAEDTLGNVQDSIPAAEDDEEVKECWVCRGDSTEDTPESSPWRHPCPCALVAHEDCLLDWIASKENTRQSGDRSIIIPAVQCPQCKAEIKLTRPKDYLVTMVRALDRLGNMAVLPGAGLLISTILQQAMMAWGKHSIYAIFGAEDGYRILRPLLVDAARPPLEVWLGKDGDVGRVALSLLLERIQYWRLYIGIPLIMPILILSRTTWADPVLPVLPMIFLVTASPADRPGEMMFKWPPSASLAFSLLFYVRSAYNHTYHSLFAEKEKEWARAIQPGGGEGQTGNDGGHGINGPNNDNVFEVRIDGEIIEEWEDADGNHHQHARPMGEPPEAEVQDQADPPPDIADNRPRPRPNANGAPAGNGDAPRRLTFQPLQLGEKLLGAIVFPSIAGISGELLKLILPSDWTSPLTWMMFGQTIRVRGGGLLSNRWARSLVGGCLFVVCKDALMLYARWRMAQIHRQRRVVDVKQPRTQ